MIRKELPRAVQIRISELLAEDRLDNINAIHREIVPADNFYVRYGKRIVDIAIALPFFILTLPVNILMGIITLFDVGRPVFFRQTRIGKNQKTFEIIKFRNMRNTTDERGELLPPSQRVTKWGKFVRKVSLDELLNFYSILKGDMSIIGPRPLVETYLPRYSKRHLGRYAVKPGLECPPRSISTGIRNWHDQFENDVWYVENLCFKTDLMMMWNLVRFTFDRKSSSVRSAAVRGSFMGYSEEGLAINLEEVQQVYVDRAIEEIEREQKLSA